MLETAFGYITEPAAAVGSGSVASEDRRGEKRRDVRGGLGSQTAFPTAKTLSSSLPLPKRHF